jgi:hypothetical protein
MPNYEDLVCRLRNRAARSDADCARRRSRRAHSARLQLVSLASAGLPGLDQYRMTPYRPRYTERPARPEVQLPCGSCFWATSGQRFGELVTVAHGSE